MTPKIFGGLGLGLALGVAIWASTGAAPVTVTQPPAAGGSMGVANGPLGHYRAAFGYHALVADQADYNQAFGTYALEENTTGHENVALGAVALRRLQTGQLNVAVGNDALTLSVDGDNNTAVGWAALYHSTGDDNTAVGNQSASLMTTGSLNAALGSASLQNCTTGTGNTGLGFQAGAGEVKTGSYNTLIGYAADVAGDGMNNSVAIGKYTKVGCSNCMALGGDGVNGTIALNVGIGKMTPIQALDVVGSGNFTATLSAGGTLRGPSTLNVLTGDINMGDAADGRVFWNGTRNVYLGYANSTSTMTLQGFGDVVLRNYSTGAGAYVDRLRIKYDTGEAIFSGPIVLGGGTNTTAAPTCDAAHRFWVWPVAGSAGVADTVAVCTKDILDAYAWRALY